jgi:hypothetical protein
MDNTLIAVTLVSLALASAMAFITLRVVMAERRRETARVATLIDLAREPELDMVDEPAFTPIVDEPPYRPVQAAIFAEPELESPAGRRLIAVAGAAAILSAIVGALMFARSQPADEAGANAQPSSVNASASSQQAPAAGTTGTTGVPLELLSLRHERDGERLTITGLVRNPRNGARLERTSAVAFVFDPDGAFVASGRALVDFMKLDPGDESPFVVTVVAPGRIGRYRIGFRGPDGAVVGHADRRQAP